MAALRLDRLVATQMRTVKGAFEPDELAYLALTSKVELPVRDRLAFGLRQRLAASGNLAVAREWRTFDLAVVTEAGEARLLLEAKAMVSFDLIGSPRKFRDRCIGDRDKMLAEGARAGAWPTLLTLVLVVHPHCPAAVPAHWDGCRQVRRPDPASRGQVGARGRGGNAPGVSPASVPAARRGPHRRWPGVRYGSVRALRPVRAARAGGFGLAGPRSPSIGDATPRAG